MFIIYGQDIERVISIITKIKEETAKQIDLLSRESDYRIETIKHTHNVFVNNDIPDAPHGHPNGAHTHQFSLQGNNPTGGSGSVGRVSDQLTYSEDYSNDSHSSHPHTLSSIIYEQNHNEPASTYIDPIVEIIEELDEELEHYETIKDEMYTENTKFNNGIGSPWREMEYLKSSLDTMIEYSESYPQLQWIGEKHALLNLMQLVVSSSIDAKWAVVTYHDWIQRGYDLHVNDKDPSITWKHFKHGKTIGNIRQDIEENVRLENPPEELF